MNQASLRNRIGLLTLLVTLVLVAMALVSHGLAVAAPAAAGVALQPSSAAKSGLRGQVVSYTLRVTNTGTLPDVITLTVTGNSWLTGIFAVPSTVIIPNTTILVALNAGEGRNIQVQVTIPTDAVGQDVATITAQSAADPGATAQSTVTTSVIFRLYLPLVTNQADEPFQMRP